MSEVKVQVICVTYNQKDYIREALDSFLMQKTNFKFEVLVGDDCSTDGTTEIVAEYAEKYPDIIKHVRREPNMGCLANFMDLCERADAKYVAFCDGDDYWTNENKLQKQYDFMEENIEYNVCAHLTKVDADPDDASYNWFKSINFLLPRGLKTETTLTIDDIAMSTPHSCSLFIRWKKIVYPEWAKTNGTMGDFVITYLQLGNKKCYLLNEIMSCYRRLGGGVSTNKMSLDEHFIKTRPEYIKLYTNIIKYFKENYNSYGTKSIEKRLESEVNNYINAINNTNKWYLLKDLKKDFPDSYKIASHIIKEKNIKKKHLTKSIIENLFSIKNNINNHKVVKICGVKLKFKQILETNWGNFFRYITSTQIFSMVYAQKIHPDTFGPYFCCNEGKDVVLFACGPTLNYYNNELKNAINIGMNRAFMKENLQLDFLFAQDQFPEGMAEINNYKGRNCQKFYGVFESTRRGINERFKINPIRLVEYKRANAKRFVISDIPYWPHDISIEPLRDMKACLFNLVQFALYTYPKRIFIVGNDCTSSGHFYSNAPTDVDFSDRIRKWQSIKELLEYDFCDIEIISINPIGLKGMFRDVYTESFLAEHPEIDRKTVEILNDKGEIK